MNRAFPHLNPFGLEGEYITKTEMEQNCIVQVKIIILVLKR